MNQEKDPKKPEFIYLGEDEEGPIDFEYSERIERERTFQEFKKLKYGSYPFFLRILTFFGGVILGITSLIPLLLSIGTLVLCILTLFRVDSVTQHLKDYWGRFRRLFVVTLGMFLATFMPALGLGLIMLSYMLEGEDYSGNLITSFVMSHFQTKTRK